MLQLNLEKPNVQVPTLKLSLNKGDAFEVTVFWDCHPDHQDDVDTHAFETFNEGAGAKVRSLEGVLSTYNTKLMSPRIGVLAVKPDGSFSTASGGLVHSKDIRVQHSTEVIKVIGANLPEGCNEVPVFASVHETDEEHHGAGEPDEAAFADIEVVTLKITAGSKTIAEYKLSDEFGEFNVVQLGSFILGDNGWEYAPVGRGFRGDLNQVLGFFS